ncbi:TetR/AcrR family transcriptional regulator [Streptacidiphilus monticola]|uniref:TetR/AcrR family transcriptional regulator n=1 Tax=Streptacidiphilus monticola TaxID=2161674 RepID=A0ABW1FYW9_9ACTN
MPRIRAATVAEHRRLQREALLGAARELLAQGGMDALTFPNLAARTGLARSSVYEYYRSRAAVVEDLCAVDFPAWARDVEAEVAAGGTAQERVAAYVRAQLRLAGDARHRAVVALSAAELEPEARERIRAAHGALVDLVVDALAQLGHPHPRLTAALLQGTIDAAVRRLDLAPAAEGHEAVIAAAVSFALTGASRAVPGSSTA